MPFQILSLSGGGYRGLFTAEILARLEQDAGRPIGECFDLIAGTSIGGIIAIGLAMGKSAKEIRELFIREGMNIFPRGERLRWKAARKVATAVSHFQGPKYDGVTLRRVIGELIGADTLIGRAQTRLLIPAVNMTKGSVQMFKTPHDSRLVTDHRLRAVDVAMATSAAPLYFPLARIEDNYFADGGLAVNSPDACAIHEAVHFARQNRDDIRVLSIGTTTTGFGLPASLGPNFGGAEWLENERLISTVLGAQQQLVDFMVGHELGDRYLRIDYRSSAEHADDLGLDLATPSRRQTLLGLAAAAYQEKAAHPLVREALKHDPPAYRQPFGCPL